MNEKALAAHDTMRLRLAAEAGDAKAQLALANVLLVHDASQRALEEALALVRAACAQGHSEALLFHALLAALGFGRPQNISEAFALTAQAAAAGSIAAKRQVAALRGADGKFDFAPWTAAPSAIQHFEAPRIYTLKRVVPPAACAWMIARGRNLAERATVIDVERGLRVSERRTNSTASLHTLDMDLVAQLINLRIAALTGVPITHQEPTNILHYKVGQQYMPHYDFIRGAALELFADEMKVIGQRIGTFLIYLNDGYEGGETAFPHLDWRFKGETGDALFFWNLNQQGEPEMDSVHAGAPVSKGEKWLFSKWIRAKPIPLNGKFYWNDPGVRDAKQSG